MNKRTWTHVWHTVCFQPCSLLVPVVWLHWVLFAGSCSSVTFYPTPKSPLPPKPQGSASSLFSFYSEHSPKMTWSTPITFAEVKWKSLSVVWLCKPMDCSPPPCPWNSPGKNTGVGSCSLPQGTFPTQGLNPGLPHYRQILYHLSHQGSPSPLLYLLKSITLF